MRVLVAGGHCYLRSICELRTAGMLREMFGQNTGYPAPDARAVARG
jgi:hypothetical protein